MVRRDDEDDQLPLPFGVMAVLSRCASPAGASPAPVGVGAPGSRSQARGEIPGTRAGCQKPLRREQPRGPQHQANTAASKHLQSEGRAAHVTAKATSNELVPKRSVDLGGVRVAERVEGGVRNARDPSVLPVSGHGAPYKPRVKSAAAQRESEESIVVLRPVEHNAGGAKGLHFDHGGEGATCEGMAGQQIRSKSPIVRRDDAKARYLQRRLWAAAKRSPERRFHALYDRIYRGDILWMAWKKVKANGGAAGVDDQTLADIEESGVEGFLLELQTSLQAKMYRPSAVRRQYIPKANGKQRPLGIPTVRDRVVQMAAKMVLEPIFEADFLPCSYGFRRRRSATGALETLRERANRNHLGNHVLDADIKGFFDNIDQVVLMDLVKKRISDKRVLKLLRQWLHAGVLEDGEVHRSTTGTPQGGVISPLLANVYLHELDRRWTNEHAHLGTLVRYADDFVVMCDTAESCEQAEGVVREILEGDLKLELHPEKTERVDLSWGKESFDFLGCTLRKRMSGPLWEKWGRRYYSLHRRPSKASMKSIRRQIHELTERRWHGVKDVRVLIRRLNPVLRGWSNYFRTGNAGNNFRQIASYLHWRLRGFMCARKGRNLKADDLRKWTRAFFDDLGLYRLNGTIRYPGAA